MPKSAARGCCAAAGQVREVGAAHRCPPFSATCSHCRPPRTNCDALRSHHPPPRPPCSLRSPSSRAPWRELATNRHPTDTFLAPPGKHCRTGVRRKLLPLCGPSWGRIRRHEGPALPGALHLRGQPSCPCDLALEGEEPGVDHGQPSCPCGKRGGPAAAGVGSRAAGGGGARRAREGVGKGGQGEGGARHDRALRGRPPRERTSESERTPVSFAERRQPACQDNRTRGVGKVSEARAADGQAPGQRGAGQAVRRRFPRSCGHRPSSFVLSGRKAA
jgi:hypothetical protein